jgi:hypothetical protein
VGYLYSAGTRIKLTCPECSEVLTFGQEHSYVLNDRAERSGLIAGRKISRYKM